MHLSSITRHKASEKATKTENNAVFIINGEGNSPNVVESLKDATQTETEINQNRVVYQNFTPLENNYI